MSPLPQHDLFPSERPVRSEYALEPSYARRRMVTVAVLAFVVIGLVYAVFGGGPSDLSEIPTIRAEGAYKEKPSDPGGIDIPHQDVRVYDQLEGKADAPPKVEHLLPPPETPKEIPSTVTPSASSSPSPLGMAAVATADSKPSESQTISSAAASSVSVAPTETPKSAAALPTGIAEPGSVNTTVVEKPKDVVTQTPVSTALPSKAESAKTDAPKPEVAKVEAKKVLPSAKDDAPKPDAQSIDEILEKVNASKKATTETPAVETLPAEKLSAEKAAGGSAAVQLASLPSEADARATMEKLKQKYGAVLGETKLRIVRADLESKGIYYRIQSEPLTKDGARQICSSLKKLSAGCILVGK